MARVDVLIAGHVAETDAGNPVHPTVSLVRDGDGHHLSDDIAVIDTPGHAQECAALVVSTEDGTVVLTHARWFADMTPVQDPLAEDHGALERSRERILALADVVVPGHGPAFRPLKADTEAREGGST